MVNNSFSESYKSAGVDITAGYEGVKRIKPLVESTFTKGIIGSIGGFGGQREKADAESVSEAETETSDSKPGGGDQTDGESPPASDEQTSEMLSGETPTAGVHRQRPSFGGMPDPSADRTNQAKTQNLITFGVCLAVIIAALILAKLFKRRK